MRGAEKSEATEHRAGLLIKRRDGLFTPAFKSS